MMKPVDEYMAFIKNGSEKVLVITPQGVRSAQCSNFDVMHKPRPSPSLNSSLLSVVGAGMPTRRGGAARLAGE